MGYREIGRKETEIGRKGHSWRQREIGRQVRSRRQSERKGNYNESKGENKILYIFFIQARFFQLCTRETEKSSSIKTQNRERKNKLLQRSEKNYYHNFAFYTTYLYTGY